MKIGKIINFLENKYPNFLAEEWDNVGLLVGNRNDELKKVLISLDITDKIIDEAIKNNSNLIITHHPIIFKPLKNITSDNSLGKKILKLIENKISVYSMHTNFDSAKLGLNDYLGENILGFKNGKILDSYEKNGIEYGIGRLYKLENSMNEKELLLHLKEKLKLKNVVVTTSEIEEIKKIAIVNGAGASYWKKAKKFGAQVLITGDVKYHDALDSKEENFKIIDVGHFESEKIFSEYIKKILLEEFDIEIKISDEVSILKNE